MNNKKYNTVSTNSTGTENGFSVDVSEVDTLLSQLLPHPEDASIHIEPEDIMYKDIHRVRLNTGIHAVQLPDGTLLAKSLDRKAGCAFWIRVRRS
ncbi:MAG: hypothetical protein WA130_08645 [Candidatus Methanoperedens sp.]